MATTSPENAAIARNYAYVLIGGFFFPLMIAAHITARKKRKERDGIGPSHYRFQFRTTSLALIATFIILSIVAVILFSFNYSTPLQQAEGRTWFISLVNASWLIFIWIAVRCIRGLYLAGASRGVQNPKTLWIWP